jgi:hypothetical protein
MTLRECPERYTTAGISVYTFVSQMLKARYLQLSRRKSMSDHWDLANNLLRYLCQGAVFDGIRFGAVKQILLREDSPKQFRGQQYINLASRWCLFPSRPSTFPLTEEDIEEFSCEDEELLALCGLRHKQIVECEFGKGSPHLILTFNDGQVFFMNGHNDKYESWELGVAHSNEDWEIIAAPGDDIIVMVPKSFNL